MTERDPQWVDAEGIGDVNSNEKGSGARFNSDKPAMELIPVRDVACLYHFKSDAPQEMIELLYHLADFQETGDAKYLYEAMLSCGTSIRDSLESCARVFDYGRRKYAEWNWAKGMKWSIPLACAVRHAMAILDGEVIDPVEQKGSGLPHIGHLMCNLVMLSLYTRTFPEGNDLPSSLLICE